MKVRNFNQKQEKNCAKIAQPNVSGLERIFKYFA
jgi:hypothetical protein